MSATTLDQTCDFTGLATYGCYHCLHAAPSPKVQRTHRHVGNGKQRIVNALCDLVGWDRMVVPAGGEPAALIVAVGRRCGLLSAYEGAKRLLIAQTLIEASGLRWDNLCHTVNKDNAPDLLTVAGLQRLLDAAKIHLGVDNRKSSW